MKEGRNGNGRKNKGHKEGVIRPKYPRENQRLPKKDTENIKITTIKRLSLTMNSIITSLTEKFRDDPSINYPRVIQELFIEKDTTEDICSVWIVEPSGNENLPPQRISLDKNSLEKENGEKIFPNFPYELNINRHTDPETMQAHDAFIEELTRSRPFETKANILDYMDFTPFLTRYYFNGSGEYKKIATMPEVVATTRNDYGEADVLERVRDPLTDSAVVSFETPMLPTDFEIISVSLIRIKEQVDAIS